MIAAEKVERIVAALNGGASKDSVCWKGAYLLTDRGIALTEIRRRVRENLTLAERTVRSAHEGLRGDRTQETTTQ